MSSIEQLVGTSSASSSDDDWQQCQNRARALQQRLSAAMARAEVQDRHEIFRNILEQLEQLSAMRPGAIPIKHFNMLLTNAEVNLGANSNLLDGSAPSEIENILAYDDGEHEMAAPLGMNDEIQMEGIVRPPSPSASGFSSVYPRLNAQREGAPNHAHSS